MKKKHKHFAITVQEFSSDEIGKRIYKLGRTRIDHTYRQSNVAKQSASILFLFKIIV